MVAAVRVHKAGGPEVLTYEQADIPAPGPNQIRIKQAAAGINYIDTYFRTGMYPAVQFDGPLIGPPRGSVITTKLGRLSFSDPNP